MGSAVSLWGFAFSFLWPPGHISVSQPTRLKDGNCGSGLWTCRPFDSRATAAFAAMDPGPSSVPDYGTLGLPNMQLEPQNQLQHGLNSRFYRTFGSSGLREHFLTRFVTRKTPTMVAGTQEASQFGDLRDKEKDKSRGEPSGSKSFDTTLEGMNSNIKDDPPKPTFPPLPPLFDAESMPHLEVLEDYAHPDAHGHDGASFGPPNALDPPQDVSEAMKLFSTTGSTTPETPFTFGSSPFKKRRVEQQGPWWRSFLPSPVRKLQLSEWRITDSQRQVGIRENDIGTKVPSNKLSLLGKQKGVQKLHRKDLPQSTLPKPLLKNKFNKPSIKRAVRLAMSKASRDEVLVGIEKDYYANSSRAAKASKAKAVETILKSAFDSAYPLDVKRIRLLGGTLKSAGYKSAHMYLAEAKINHVERGFVWSEQLTRELKLCIAAAKRGVGPRKKAMEVQEDDWAKFSIYPGEGVKGTKVHLSSHLFAVGVHWMMREIEIAALRVSDVSFDTKNKMVSLVWRTSKNDQSASSCTRTLQCLCGDKPCDLKCPFSVLQILCNTPPDGNLEKEFVSVTKEGKRATKKDLVDDWQLMFGQGVTGHSTRRSGALQAIRRGWTISQTAFLGRWKSNIIMEYAQEALQSMPVNVGNKFDKDAKLAPVADIDNPVARQSSMPKDVAVLEGVYKSLKSELDNLKKDGKKTFAIMNKEIRDLKAKQKSEERFLPPYVKSTRHQVVHVNMKTLVFIQPHSWKTVCGWHFYHTNKYEFLNGTKELVTCSKCQSIAFGKEGWDAIFDACTTKQVKHQVVTPNWCQSPTISKSRLRQWWDGGSSNWITLWCRETKLQSIFVSDMRSVGHLAILAQVGPHLINTMFWFSTPNPPIYLGRKGEMRSLMPAQPSRSNIRLWHQTGANLRPSQKVVCGSGGMVGVRIGSHSDV